MDTITSLALLELTPVSLRSNDGLGRNDFAATLLEIRAGVYWVSVMVQHRINAHVSPPVQMNCVCDGRRYSRIQAHGDAGTIPVSASGMRTDDTDCRILRTTISDRFVRSIAEQIGVRADITPRLQWRDACVCHPAAALGAELQTEDTFDALYVEGLCMALVVRLLSSSRDDAARVAGRADTLAPCVTTRTVNYIEAHLHARLMLAELVAQAGLGVPHFNVLFRTTLDVPAHRYIVQHRVACVKTLLLEGCRSASQVVLDAGFTHQSHMTQWT